MKEYLLTPNLEDPQPNIIEKATISMDRDTFVLNPIDRAAAHRTSAPLVRESEIKQNLKPIKSTQLSPIARMQMEQKHV